MSGVSAEVLDELAELDAAAEFARSVDRHAYELRVREAARVKVAAERAVSVPGFDAGLLGEVLARPEGPPHRVEGLIPADASTLLSAAKKTGKTTMTLNLARCLLTGEDFLGRFPVIPVKGRVALLNYEVTGAQVARWASEVGVPQDRLLLVNLRGRRNPLLVPDDRKRLADLLGEHGTETLIVDPFGRAYNGKSQNDAAEVGGWLVALDQFARSEAGVKDLVLTAHAGWDGERTRGSSALEDWGDVILTLTRDNDDAARRYLSAEGRDVLVEEDRLDYDPTTRMLTLAGVGSRTKAKAARRESDLVQVVVALVSDEPGLSTRRLDERLRDQGVTVRNGDGGKAARRAVESGHLRSEHGPRGAVLYFPRSPVPTAPHRSPGALNDCSPSPYIGDGSGRVDATSPLIPEPRCSHGHTAGQHPNLCQCGEVA